MLCWERHTKGNQRSEAVGVGSPACALPISGGPSAAFIVIPHVLQDHIPFRTTVVKSQPSLYLILDEVDSCRVNALTQNVNRVASHVFLTILTSLTVLRSPMCLSLALVTDGSATL